MAKTTEEEITDSEEMEDIIADFERQLDASSRFYMKAAVHLAQKQMHSTVFGDEASSSTESINTSDKRVPFKRRIVRWLLGKVLPEQVLERTRAGSYPNDGEVIDLEARDITDEE